MFLDSDDWLVDDCIENRVKEFEKGKRDVDFLMFDMMLPIDGKSGSIWKYDDRKKLCEKIVSSGETINMSDETINSLSETINSLSETINRELGSFSLSGKPRIPFPHNH